MKLRWSHKDFTCMCGKKVKTGDLSYLCKCCGTQVCKICGEVYGSKKND